MELLFTVPHFFLHFQLEEEEAFASSIDRKKDLDLKPSTKAKKGRVGEVRGGFPSLDSWKDFLTLRL